MVTHCACPTRVFLDRALHEHRRPSSLPSSCCGLLHPNLSAIACRGENPNEHIG